MDFEEPGRTEERKDGTDSGEMEGADPEIVSKGVPLGDCHGLDEDGGFLFLENAEKEDRIVICGAGYVGHALAKLSVFAGIRTIVLEDREYFAELAKKSGAHEVICLPFDEAVRSLNDEKNTAYVVMTRGHAYDQKCLMEIAKKESYYTGMMGSRTRAP